MFLETPLSRENGRKFPLLFRRQASFYTSAEGIFINIFVMISILQILGISRIDTILATRIKLRHT